MTIPASATVPDLLAPNLRQQFVDSNGVLNTHGWQVLTGFLNFMQGTNRIIPCNASGTNLITLTMLSVSPLITKYNDFDTFRFVATATSTSTVTAQVVTPQGALTTLKVYINRGATVAGAGDVVINLQYDLTYVDSFDAGNGGLVIR